MSGFIVKAACLGSRPSQFAGYSGLQRAELISRLLKERGVARFLVAPAGYGKTSLLIDYAETVFSWVHVFWVNGKSPCFLRDLDEGTIAGDCRKSDPSVRLVVFDDVPVLDAARARALSDQIDALISGGSEVVVACTPCGDVFGQLQRDRVCLRARDLLANDDEAQDARAGDGQSVAGRARRIPESCRVPALVWPGRRDEAGCFLRDTLKEQMPVDLLLCMASMVVVQRGSLEDLRSLGPLDLDLVADLVKDYPHLGFDVDTRRFETPLFEMEDVAFALKGAMDQLVSRSAFDARDQLVCAWADLLGRSGRAMGRACDAVRALCPRGRRAAWLSAHALDVVRSGCFFEAYLFAQDVRQSSREGMASDRARCRTLEAVCLARLGDGPAAVGAAKRLAFEESGPPEVRATCLLVVARHGASALRDNAEARLAQLVETGCLAGDSYGVQWESLANLWEASRAELPDFSAAWGALHDADADDVTLCLGASWLFAFVLQEYAADGESAAVHASPGLVEAERYVRNRLAEADDDAPDFLVASAGLSMEHAHMGGMPYAQGALSTSALLLLRRVEMVLVAQRARYERAVDSKRDGSEAGPRALARVSGSGELAGAPGRRARAVPVLRVRLFGRFEVAVGDDVLDVALFRRKHVRFLLLILSINLGRELSRDSLARQLWPEATEEQAKRNFYVTWSRLRRALTLSDGSCPYLVKHQYGCSLDERFVQSDVARFNEICRELLFGKPDVYGWKALYSELDELYRDELLPSEEEVGIVATARQDYRSRLVDALVSATQGVIDEGDARLAIWLARAAVGHDETREDAYLALMNAQVAAGKRTAAMMTYHACRRALAEHLGVDPSPEIVALYESLLDAE